MKIGETKKQQYRKQFQIMISRLTIGEFRSRIQKVTAIGYPKVKLSPFGFLAAGNGISKTFYGMYDNSSYHLTMNSAFSSTFYIIKGNYKTSGQQLHIQYAIEPRSKYQAAWILYFPVFTFLLMNAVLISEPPKDPVQGFVVANLFIVCMAIYARWRDKRSKRKMEKKFIETFEIEKEA
jgi:hypothetical protein